LAWPPSGASPNCGNSACTVARKLPARAWPTCGG
jgi:hypothetical protein